MRSMKARSECAACGVTRPLRTFSPSRFPGRRRAGCSGPPLPSGSTLRQLCQRPELAAGEPEVLGPAPAPVVKVNNRYRYRCTLIGRNDKATREMLAWLQKSFARDSANRGLNLFVDHNAAD